MNVGHYHIMQSYTGKDWVPFLSSYPRAEYANVGLQGYGN